MPICREMQYFYPIDWPEIAQIVKAEAGWRCKQCGRPHCPTKHDYIWQLADGRWWDAEIGFWRDDRGKITAFPRGDSLPFGVKKRVIIAVAHLDNNPQNNTRRNLRALCGRCHLRLDREWHIRRRRIRSYMDQGYVADLLDGDYLSLLMPPVCPPRTLRWKPATRPVPPPSAPGPQRAQLPLPRRPG